jgi:hypothetical protein
MRIDSAGNVGIGDTNPMAKLDVSGNIRTTAWVAPASGAGMEFGYTGYGSILAYDRDTSAYKELRIDGSKLILQSGAGNVGIGTTNPVGYRLVVENTAEDLLKLHNSTDGLDSLIAFSNPGGTLARIQGLDNGGLAFDTGNNAGGINSNAMRIDSVGNVGIGTTIPRADSYTRGLTIGNSTDGGAQLVLQENTLAGGWRIFNNGYLGFIANNDERMRINDGGNVIIGEDSINGSFGASNTIFAVSGSTSGGEGIIQITGKGNNATDNVGKLTFHSYAEADPMCSISSIRGSGDDVGDLAFSTNNGGTVTERMRITSLGITAVGKSTDLGVEQSGFFVHPNDFMSYTNTSTDSGDRCLILNRQNGIGNIVDFKTGNSIKGKITISGTAVAYNTTSDYRLKEDLKDFNGLDLVSNIPVYDYKWKVDESRSYGVMAHELQEVLPQAVVGEKDAEEMQSVDYSKIVPVLIKAIQELTAKVAILEQK